MFIERANGKYRSKCSCSLKNIARINTEDRVENVSKVERNY